MVLSLIPSGSLDTFLNNLSEADFDLKHFQVVKTATHSQKNLFKKLKLSPDHVSQIQNGLKNHLVLIIGNHYPDADIISMLNDYQPQLLLTL